MNLLNLNDLDFFQNKLIDFFLIIIMQMDQLYCPADFCSLYLYTVQSHKCLEKLSNIERSREIVMSFFIHGIMKIKN